MEFEVPLDVTNTLDGKIWEKARMDRELAAILMLDP